MVILLIELGYTRSELTDDAIDPWEAMSADATDIVPYWIYTVEGGAHIERRVLAHPLSRDVTRLHELLKSLTLYRMAFGQARQEDLVRYLQGRVPESDWARVAAIAAIKIAPASRDRGAEAGAAERWARP
jgi:hypothetical protein